MNNVTSLKETLVNSQLGLIYIARKDALTLDINTHLIDTCLATDINEWETGIRPKNKSWIIVEQYENKKEATKGHNEWVEKLRINPKLDLNDVMEYGF